MGRRILWKMFSVNMLDALSRDESTEDMTADVMARSATVAPKLGTSMRTLYGRTVPLSLALNVAVAFLLAIEKSIGSGIEKETILGSLASLPTMLNCVLGGLTCKRIDAIGVVASHVHSRYGSTDSATALKDRADLFPIKTRMCLNRMNVFYELINRPHKINLAKYISVDSSDSSRRLMSRRKHNKHFHYYFFSLDLLKKSFSPVISRTGTTLTLLMRQMYHVS